MKTKLFLIPIFCFLFFSAYPQVDQTLAVKNNTYTHDRDQNASGAGSNASSTGFNVKNDLGEECSMYLNENFTRGTLTFKDQTVFTDQSYRFNMYNQQMEFISDSDTAAIGNPEEIKSLVIDDQKFIYTDYVSNSIYGKGFMELLVDGKYKLYLKRAIKYTYRQPTAEPDNVMEEKYYLGKTYFTGVDQETPRKTLLDKKYVINHLQVSGKNIKRYLKKQGNQMKTEADLVDLINYCNQTIE